MIVTAAETSNAFQGCLLKVYVITGQTTGPIGNISALEDPASGPLAAALTTTHPGSLVYGALETNRGQVSFTTQSGTTITAEFDDHGNGATYAVCRTTNPVTTPGSVTVGANETCTGTVALLEILPGSGLVEDLSTPPVVSTATLTTLDTADFSPPPGSMLLALFCGEGDGSQPAGVTVSDSLGLAWTRQVFTSTGPNGFSGAWTAVLPVAPPQTQTRRGRSRTLMTAIVPLFQTSSAAPLPKISIGQLFWADDVDVPFLVTGNLASIAPPGSSLLPEPPHTVNGVPGLGAATANSSG